MVERIFPVLHPDWVHEVLFFASTVSLLLLVLLFDHLPLVLLLVLLPDGSSLIPVGDYSCLA